MRCAGVEWPWFRLNPLKRHQDTAANLQAAGSLSMANLDLACCSMHRRMHLYHELEEHVRIATSRSYLLLSTGLDVTHHRCQPVQSSSS